MNYDYYRTFYYVGKHKSLSKAAAELYSSQPAISRTIQKLEAELGCQLFIRGKTGVTFTTRDRLCLNTSAPPTTSLPAAKMK